MRLLSNRRSRPEEVEVPAGEGPAAAPDEERAAHGRGRSPAWKAALRDRSLVEGQLLPGVLLVAGIVAVILGWYGAARSSVLAIQMPYLISGGLLGLGLIIAAGVLASVASAREARALRRSMASALDALRAGAFPTIDEGVASLPATRDGLVLVLPQGQSFHVRGCPIVEDREGVREVSRAKAVASGYSVCKLCARD